MSCECDWALVLWGWCWDWDDDDDDDDEADHTTQMARDLDASFRTTPSPMPQGSDWSPWAPAGSLHNQPRTPSPMPPRLPSPPRDGDGHRLLAQPRPSTAAGMGSRCDVPRRPNPVLSTSPLAQAAVPLLLTLASTHNLPEAVFLRATFSASGAYPNLVPQNPRAAFRDFEAAARAGYSAGWFRLARDYEQFNDTTHALDCLARGTKARDPAALHRLGTAHLLAQLGLPADTNTALPYLHQAACRASLQCPQPAYVFALILLQEFTVNVPPAALVQFLPPGQSHEAYARAMLERAAALHFAPAQYKLGHAFEFAVPPSAFPFEPLLSVQWYSLASQAGEAEADMALSKWFLCGAEGAFEKDESLARTFATKAAAKGLASGEFAMGYYCEVGIGAPKDVAEARGWYSKAAAHGNADATERLRALQQPTPQMLGRSEHDALTENKLVRKRTQARIRSEGVGAGPGAYTAEPASFANPHPEMSMPDPYGVAVGVGRGQAPQQQQQQQQGPPSAYRPGPQDRRTRVMELARKSSIAEAAPPGQGHARMGSAGSGGGYGFDYRQGGPSQPVYGSPNSRTQALPGRMPQPQQQQRLHPRDASLPPQSQQQQQQQQQQRPASGAGAGRGYALNDTGAGSRPGSVAGLMASGAGGGGGGRPTGTPPLRRPLSAVAAPASAPSTNTNPNANAQPPPPMNANANANGTSGSASGSGSGFVTTKTGGGGPATFAEMGFTGAKAEDKECVVM
ncbi:hypothetical protein C8F01DRAFT_1254702 [Mycena amicta]|nr:hypothetical protein C8F01DRAFT_1254702 [Mycena amicta]